MNRPVCRHPVVRVVAREDDAEFVECQSCGEIFDSVEYEDMAVEAKEELDREPGLELDGEVDL